ncbi:uncharacterized protein LOC129169836 [Dunckerocampus dactyliophorus]|uniref:uncharacterized protein LOC129169836 n=1 Tax=Dunckerocampus dactyliophorus TaxID=161453 RepID=UPI00240583D8|nr:uncharacterized protein LOC129169836 [Dunckerocampus dactyliophorus]
MAKDEDEELEKATLSISPTILSGSAPPASAAEMPGLQTHFALAVPDASGDAPAVLPPRVPFPQELMFLLPDHRRDPRACAIDRMLSRESCSLHSICIRATNLWMSSMPLLSTSPAETPTACSIQQQNDTFSNT